MWAMDTILKILSGPVPTPIGKKSISSVWKEHTREIKYIQVL